jgi:hypothetical protein
MRDLVLWTWVVGGAPLALALTQWAVECLRDVIRAGTTARGSAAGERTSSDSALRWTPG